MKAALTEVDLPLRRMAADAVEAERQREIEREAEEGKRRASLLTDNLQILARRILGIDIPARMIEVIGIETSCVRVVATVDGVRLQASERRDYGGTGEKVWTLYLLVPCVRCEREDYRIIRSLADLGCQLVEPGGEFICDHCRHGGADE